MNWNSIMPQRSPKVIKFDSSGEPYLELMPFFFDAESSKTYDMEPVTPSTNESNTDVTTLP